MSEFDEQCLVIGRAEQLIDMGYNKLRLLHSSLNGATMPARMSRSGKRISTTAMKQRLAGMKAGVPDLFLPVGSDGFRGLYIEMKAITGKLDPKQRLWMHALTDEGFLCCVCFTADVVISPDLRSGLILDYFNSPQRLCAGFMHIYKPHQPVKLMPLPKSINWQQWDLRVKNMTFVMPNE